MPDQPQGGTSVATTTAIALPTGAGLIVLQYLVQPVWPPPSPVLTIVATALVPVAHLIGKAFMGRLTRAAAELDEPEAAPAPVPIPAAVVVEQLPAPAPIPPPAVPVPPAPPPAPPQVGGVVLQVQGQNQ